MSYLLHVPRLAACSKTMAVNSVAVGDAQASQECSRCAILTFHFVNNYGALWQAYALRHFLQSAGAAPTFINYRPPHVEAGGRLKLPRTRADHHANAVNLYLRIRRLQKTLFGSAAQQRAFQEFQSDEIAPATRQYQSGKELVNSPPSADVLICGSDQVWHPSKQFGLDPTYFLDFGSNQQRRVSYAASFGKASVNREHRPAIARLLKRFDAISVREESGVTIVRELIGREAQLMPDPTLLLQDYHEPLTKVDPAVAEIPGRPYVFSYALRDTKSVEKIAANLALEKGVDHFIAMSAKFVPVRRRNCLFPGPYGWLQLLKNADYVVTNSFHGTVFSILFQKQFIYVPLPPPKQAYNDRAESLLLRMNLGSRRSADQHDVKSYADARIHWPEVESKLGEIRARGRDYLLHAIR